MLQRLLMYAFLFIFNFFFGLILNLKYNIQETIPMHLATQGGHMLVAGIKI